jgi:ubiquitin C-terminal hydrolase
MQKTVVTCGKCNNKSITYNPFMTLSLAFESSIDKCITHFLKEDTLDSKDQYKCEKCNQNSKAKIKTELSKLPNILVFHLKRFTFPSMKKLKGIVRYNATIDMSK